MAKLTIVWEKPYTVNDRIPSRLVGAVGLYIFEVNSKVLYIGKSEEQGGFKRAKDHFRGQMDKTGKCIIEKSGKGKECIKIHAGWLEEGEDRYLIDDAEKLFIWHFNPPCNKTCRELYQGNPLMVTNEGEIPNWLPGELISTPQVKEVK